MGGKGEAERDVEWTERDDVDAVRELAYLAWGGERAEPCSSSGEEGAAACLGLRLKKPIFEREG